jgi:hypothetical protein
MIVTIVTLWLFRVPMRFWGAGGYRHHHRHPIVTIVTRRWGDGPGDGPKHSYRHPTFPLPRADYAGRVAAVTMVTVLCRPLRDTFLAQVLDSDLQRPGDRLGAVPIGPPLALGASRGPGLTH